MDAVLLAGLMYSLECENCADAVRCVTRTFEIQYVAMCLTDLERVSKQKSSDLAHDAVSDSKMVYREHSVHHKRAFELVRSCERESRDCSVLSNVATTENSLHITCSPIQVVCPNRYFTADSDTHKKKMKFVQERMAESKHGEEAQRAVFSSFS